jgi:hypothetical protein
MGGGGTAANAAAAAAAAAKAASAMTVLVEWRKVSVVLAIYYFLVFPNHPLQDVMTIDKS